VKLGGSSVLLTLGRNRAKIILRKKLQQNQIENIFIQHVQFLAERTRQRDHCEETPHVQLKLQ